jgi:feruloyl esterase
MERVELSKDLIAAYYGKQIEYSYYTGCSAGGRQGLKEAQLCADSFDGMLIGAPGWWTTHFVSWITKLSKDFYPAGSPKSIPSGLFSLVASTVTEQCDGLDGVEDGVINDPDLCTPLFDVLSCGNPASNSSMCLIDAQLDTLAKIYSDYTVDSKLAYPSLELSSEPQWSTFLFGGQPNPFGIDFMRYAAFNDPQWPLDNYNDSVLGLVAALDPGKSTADEYDMSAYRDRGGKILMYHGLSDGLIPTRGSPYFYEQVATATGTSYPVEDWFRLFLVPGMMHCSASAADAPWYFNGAGQAGNINSSIYSVPGYQDSRHDALLALVDWVENLNKVEQLIATSWKNWTDLNQGVSRQRPLCPYPRRAVYGGQGNADEPESWTCQ